MIMGSVSSGTLAGQETTLIEFGDGQPFVGQVGGSIVIKRILEARVPEKLIPRLRRSGRIIGGGDGGEPIIEDNVKLGTDVLGREVKNQRDGTGMSWTQAEEDTATGARLPNRNLLAVT